MNQQNLVRSISCVTVAGLSLSLGIVAGCSRPNPGEVAIDYVDAIQSVQQSVAPLVPLLTGKKTYVRVYLRSGRGDVAGVGARLTIAGMGTVSPIGSATVTARPTGYDPWGFADVLIFHLTDAMTVPGNRTAEIDLITPSGHPATVDSTGRNLGHWSLPLSFGADGPPTLTIHPVRYRYTNVPEDYRILEGLPGPTYPERQRSELEPSRLFAENILPLARLDVDWSLEDRFGVGSFDCDETGAGTAAPGCGSYVDARQWAGDRIDEMFPIGGHWVVVIQPEVSRGDLHGLSCQTPAGNHRINLWLEPASATGVTLAHELGHTLGLGHTQNVGSFIDPTYPRPDGSMGLSFGWRTTPTLQLEPGQDATGRIGRHDLMSYLLPQWISPYHYCAAMRVTTAGQVRCSNSLDRSGAFALGTSVSSAAC